MLHDHGCKVTPKLPAHWNVYTSFGGVGSCYRYYLQHRWARGPLMLFAMMNPSGADEDVGDMTVLKTAAIALHHGCGGQIVVNACALRAVSPKTLLMHPDPVGEYNSSVIRRSVRRAEYLVVAHGKLPGDLQRHANSMVSIMRESGKPLYVLGLTQDGVPMHPLARGRNYIAPNTGIISWSPQ